MSEIRSALIYSALTGYGQRLCNLISVVVVSRLLMPEEIGVYAVAASVSLVVAEIKTLGAGAYLIRQKNLEPSMIRSASGLMFLICWGAAILLFLSAPFLAEFYDIPDMKAIIWVSCIAFLLTPTMSVIRSLLSREYQFKKIFVIVLCGRLLTVLFNILLIYQGLSYFSLAIAAAIGAIAEFVIALLLRPKDMPLLPAFSGLKPIFNFGLFVTLDNLCRKFTLVLPDIIIGKRGATADVAIFSRGVGFLDFLFNSLQQGVGGVALPYLSEQQRQGRSLEAPYLRATDLLGAVVWPVLVVAGVAARPAIIVFFGDQWEASTVLVPPLCLWMLLRSVHAFAPQLFITLNKERLLFTKELIVFILSAGVIWFFYSAGLAAIANALAVVGLIDFLITAGLLRAYFDFSFARFLRASAKNIVLTVVCGAAAMAVNFNVDFAVADPLFAMGVLAPVMVCVWFATLYLLRHPLGAEVSSIIRRK